MKDVKVVFMGSPEFSLPVLKYLIDNTNVIAVVTQPDKEVGRKKVLTAPPVKTMAIQYGIKVLQPVKLRNEYKCITDLNPDIIITCAYGQILPFELLDFPKYKTINVHASLLPKYRGGAPIHHAIINGEKETGITIMRTDAGMDSGDLIGKEVLNINDDDTYDVVNKSLSELGAIALSKYLPKVIDGTALYEKQNNDEVSFAYVIKREDEKLNFNDKTINVHNKIRGLSSIPSSYAILDGEEVKIYNSRIGNGIPSIPGKITNIYKDGIGVSTIDGEIVITDLKMFGKKRMLAKDYLNGVDKEKLILKMFK